MTVIMGLDLSLNAAAAVVVPADWDGRWGRVQSLVVGEKLAKTATLEARAKRTHNIALKLQRFAEQRLVTHAYIEGYAFSRRDQAHSLGELGGVVKLFLSSQGIQLHTAPMGTARKLLLGKVPRSGAAAKTAVYDAFVAAGKRFESLDESDAMCAANYGLSELGGFFFGQVEAA